MKESTKWKLLKWTIFLGHIIAVLIFWLLIGVFGKI